MHIGLQIDGRLKKAQEEVLVLADKHFFSMYRLQHRLKKGKEDSSWACRVMQNVSDLRGAKLVSTLSLVVISNDFFSRSGLERFAIPADSNGTAREERLRSPKLGLFRFI
jgi:hypothetical protein